MRQSYYEEGDFMSMKHPCTCQHKVALIKSEKVKATSKEIEKLTWNKRKELLSKLVSKIRGKSKKLR